MAPTGQTVAAVLLGLGLARGPSEAPPSDPELDSESGVVSADAASGAPDGEAGFVDPEPESDPVEPESPVDPAEALATAETTSETTAAALEETDPPPPVPDLPATAPPPELQGENAWVEESWEDEEDEMWEDDYDPLRDSPEALKAQRRIAGGAVVLGLGAMVSFGGLAMVLSDPCARPAGNSCAPASRNRAAATMALPGLATVAVGSVMLVLGIRQRKALRVDAGLTASGGGVSFRGRF